MTETGNEGVVRKIYEEYNRRNLDTLMDFMADDITYVDVFATTYNKKGMRKMFKEFYLETFSDQRLRADRIVSQGNTVMVEYTWSGTHVKDWAGIPAKGKKFEVHGVEIFVFEVGKVKLYKTYANPNILIQQLREK